MRFLLGLLFISFIPFFGIAQRTKTIRADHQWLHNYAQFRVSERVNVLADAGFRVRNAFQEPTLYIVRVGGTYNVHPKWKVGVGFAHSGRFTDSKLSVLEYRPHQEVISEHIFSGVEITNRLRIEERV